MLDSAINQLAYRLKTIPAVFRPIAWLREDSKKRLVRRDSDIAIEGFWRCGNHFATYAFIVAQQRNVRVAHHFHAPAQLMLADRWGIPAILLIRNPIDAVASSAIYLQRDPGPMLRLYEIFHRSLVPYADRIVVSDFDDTVGNFGGVIERVNQRYDRQFRAYRGDDVERKEVERRIREEHESRMGAEEGTLPLPSEVKAQRKQAVIDRLHDPACAELLLAAQGVYETLRKSACQAVAHAKEPSGQAACAESAG